MAVGDIINDVVAIANGATSDFQPAAGVSIIITHVAGGQGAHTQALAGLYDGSLFSGKGCATRTTTATNNNWNLWKMGITNTNYLRMNNNSAGSTQNFSYSGIQIK